MRIQRRMTGFVCFVIFLAGPAAAWEPPRMPDPSAEDYDWRAVAHKHGLADGEVKALGKRKVLMTNEAFRQVFTPYVEADLPMFITSDSLLAAFHVLYEESVLRMEQANARRLPEILSHVWRGLEAEKPSKDAGTVPPRAYRRARVVVGTALALLDEELDGVGEDGARLVGKEVRKIREARTLDPKRMAETMPAWLGTPDDTFFGIDYSRFKPRGFYTTSHDLERYFRAVAWLQSIPFRVSKDEELGAALLLGRAADDNRFASDADRRRFSAYFWTFGNFLGTRDDWDLLEMARAAKWVDDLKTTRKWLLEQARLESEQPHVNDLVRFPPMDPRAAASEPNFRILSAHRTPDAILFHRTTDLRDFVGDRLLPSSLEVAASLGSDYARARVPGPQREKVLRILDETRPVFHGQSLYCDYLGCLGCLLDEPEPDAPAFLKGEPWQAKSCQTALAGWSQLRHTWALQAKQSVTYLCAMILPPGFVEPEPEFFGSMAGLVERTRDRLDRAGALELDTAQVARDIREVAAVLTSPQAKKGGRMAITKAFEDAPSRGEWAMFLMNCLKVRPDPKDEQAYLKKAAAELRKMAQRFDEGAVPDNEWLQRLLAKHHEDIRPLWDDLLAVCRRLETLAHKQLRGRPLDQDDRGFIERYGTRIAGVMLYGGNSYVSPRDDAPRAIDVHYDPNTGRYLEVGIARPRALYVLYPHEGAEVLCRGAVLPYYEFAHGERLTDAGWKALLDSDERPAIPEWTRPVTSPNGIGRATPEKP
jgi:hypothetical protein